MNEPIVRVVNSAAGKFDYGDGDSPIHQAANQFRWDVLKLSPKPPIDGHASFNVVNGALRSLHSYSGEAVLDRGLCASTSQADQVAAVKRVAELTIDYIAGCREGADQLTLGGVSITMELAEGGLRAILSVKFEWSRDVTVAGQ